MIKTGICTLRELQKPGALKGFFGGARLPSISLYQDALEAGEGLSELVLERLADARGAYKRTYKNRFEDFDAQILPLIQERFDLQTSLSVHDAGVSDGRTACDFYAKISALYPHLRYHASDYDMVIRLVRTGNAVVAFSAAGAPLEIMAPPFVHSVNRPENFLFYPLNYLHRLYALKAVLPAAQNKLGGLRDITDIGLWCAEAQKLQDTDPGFHLMFHDLLRPFAEKSNYHIIRAMNVLNSEYFQQTEQALISRHLLSAIREGGILILGKNENSNSLVNGAVYETDGKRFQALSYLGKEKPPFDQAILAARV